MKEKPYVAYTHFLFLSDIRYKTVANKYQKTAHKNINDIHQTNFLLNIHPISSSIKSHHEIMLSLTQRNNVTVANQFAERKFIQQQHPGSHYYLTKKVFKENNHPQFSFVQSNSSDPKESLKQLNKLSERRIEA